MIPTYSGTRGDRYFYYQCCRKYNGTVDCSVRSVPAEQLEHIVAERIRRIARNSDILEEAMLQALEIGSEELTRANSSRADIKKQICSVDTNIQNIVAFVRTTCDGDGRKSTAMAKELDRLERQKLSLEDELKCVDGQIRDEESKVVNKGLVKDSCTFFDTVFDVMTEAEKRDLILTFVQSVTYTSEKIRIELFSQPIPREKLGKNGELDPLKQHCSVSGPDWLPGLDSNQQPCGYERPALSDGLGLSHHPEGCRALRPAAAAAAGLRPCGLVSARSPTDRRRGFAQGSRALRRPLGLRLRRAPGLGFPEFTRFFNRGFPRKLLLAWVSRWQLAHRRSHFSISSRTLLQLRVTPRLEIPNSFRDASR